MTEYIEIPTDVYESREELVVIVPLGGVAKESIKVRFVDGVLQISGERAAPKLRDGFVPLEQQCYRGVFDKQVPLPASVYHDKVHVECYADNILVVIIPKMIVPEERDYSINFLPQQHTTRSIVGSEKKRSTTKTAQHPSKKQDQVQQ